MKNISKKKNTFNLLTILKKNLKIKFINYKKKNISNIKNNIKRDKILKILQKK